MRVPRILWVALCKRCSAPASAYETHETLESSQLVCEMCGSTQQLVPYKLVPKEERGE